MALKPSGGCPVDLNDAIFDSFLRGLPDGTAFVLVLYRKNDPASDTMIDVSMPPFCNLHPEIAVHSVAVAESPTSKVLNPRVRSKLASKETIPSTPAICIGQALSSEQHGFKIERCVWAGVTVKEQHQKLKDSLRLIQLWLHETS